MEDYNTITIGRIFKVAFKRWKLFIPVAAFIAIVGSLLILFIYNPHKANYVAKFSYTGIDLQRNEYADGSSFSYGQLLSIDNLEDIKKSKDVYQSIDVNGMASKDKIKISREIEKDNYNTGTGTYTYTLEMNRKYFKSFEQASGFANDIAYSAISEDLRKIDNFNIGETIAKFEDAKTFESQIKMLSNQAEVIENLYGKYVISNNKDNEYPTYIYSMALENQKNLDGVYSDRDTTALSAEISKYGFVKDYSIINLEEEKSSLLQEKSDNDAALKIYTDQISSMAGGAAITGLPAVVDNLTKRNSEIANELIAVDAKIAHKVDYDSKDEEYMKKYNAFVSKLDSYKDTLENETNIFKDFLQKSFVESGTIDFQNASIIEQKGNINTVIAIVISALLGIVAGAVVNLIVDRRKLYE